MSKKQSPISKPVTIIIVTYKSAHIVGEALDPLINKGYRIIIIDNGSNDNIKEYLQKNYSNSGIELISLKYNCGFGKANNIALKLVKTKYALVLNPDAIMTDKAITQMVQCADKDFKAALVNPLFFINESGIKKHFNNIKEFQESHKDNMVKQSNFMCGGALLMKMAIFKKIGFFDENIFLYGEDDEISHRTIANNYKMLIVQDCYCLHANQKSSKTQGTIDKLRLLYFRYWHQGWGKTYLKRRQKNIIRIILKAFHRLFLSLFYLLKLDLRNCIVRFALFMGSIANILAIDCFNKNNKNPQIEYHITI